MIARIGQVIHHRRKVFTQLPGITFCAIDHFFQIVNLLSELPAGFDCGCVRKPLGLLLQLKGGPLGTRISLGEFFPKALALPVQLFRSTRCGSQELLLCLLNGFFKLGQFFAHSLNPLENSWVSKQTLTGIDTGRCKG